VRKQLSERLVGLLDKNEARDWCWYEEKVTYDNARLPQALIVSGARMDNVDMTAAGLRSLGWLLEIQRSKEGYFAPVGSNGFYARSTDKALFDQQPLEACAMVSACLDAFRVTRDERWVLEMQRAFRWFLGQNQLNTSLYDPRTGGCRDGLHVDRPNENQGAESTLSFLISLSEMNSLESEIHLREGSLLGPNGAERPQLQT
jgi:hypothetical protein